MMDNWTRQILSQVQGRSKPPDVSRKILLEMTIYLISYQTTRSWKSDLIKPREIFLDLELNYFPEVRRIVEMHPSHPSVPFILHSSTR